MEIRRTKEYVVNVPRPLFDYISPTKIQDMILLASSDCLIHLQITFSFLFLSLIPLKKHTLALMHAL